MTTLFPRTLVPTALSGRHARTPATALEPARPERAPAPERARAARFSR